MGVCSAKANLPANDGEEVVGVSTRDIKYQARAAVPVTPREMTNPKIHSSAARQKELSASEFDMDIDEMSTKRQLKNALGVLTNSFNISKEALVPLQNADFYSKFNVYECVGKGSQGKVYRVIDKDTKVERAMKVVRTANTEKFDDSFLNEAMLLRHLDHPNILKVFEGVQSADKFGLVTELCKGGCLLTHVNQSKSVSERDAALVIKSVLSSVAYLHSKNIVHRDIKLENIILQSQPEYIHNSARIGSVEVKLIDFALASIITPGIPLTTRCGTVTYMAPEVINKSYDEKCDIWSCGIVLYGMLMKRLPFDGGQDKDILRKILSNEVDFSKQVYPISPRAKDLLLKMLEKDPAKRISAKDALNHEFIRNFSNGREAGSVCIDANWLNKAVEASYGFSSKRAELLYETVFLADNEQMRATSNAFKNMDIDKDGVISLSDIKTYFVDTTAEDADDIEEKCEALLRAYDFDGSGSLEYSEFVCAFLSTRDDRESKLQELQPSFTKFFEENNLRSAATTVCSLSNNDYDALNPWNKLVTDLVKEKGRENLRNAAYLKLLRI